MAAVLCTMAMCGAPMPCRTARSQTSPVGNAPPARFVHPGLLHSRDDLDRIRDKVKAGEQPWAAAWEAFNRGNRWIGAGYTPRPLETVGRGVGATGQDNIANDCTAAYYNALAWYVSGDEAYAKKSIEIMNAWSNTCRQINGKDAVLCAGIYGYKLMNAAEIIRYTYNGWPEKDVRQFTILARDVFYPVIKDFATFANGNWDAAAEAAMISMAVFLDDRPMFDRAARYYLDGAGDGAVRHYIINDAGQLQESGRDQPHSQLGIGLLSCTAEAAYHQGIDLYAAFDHRLLKGFEYTARYNLGEQVPFETTTDRTGKYTHTRISPSRPPTMQIYEMVFNHYVNVAGIDAPFTARAAAFRRPETLAIDQVGAGTLLFTLPRQQPAARVTPPAPAGPMTAKGAGDGINLLWPASVHATRYILQRAAAADGPWQTLATDLHTVTFRDTTTIPGNLYFYQLSAANSAGAGAASLPVSASAGLPRPWTSADVGAVPVKGEALYDGTTFTLEASGANIGGRSDQFHFVGAPQTGDAILSGRYVPQTPSQFARMGLMMRASNAPDSPFVAALITPESTGDVEAPNWHLSLTARDARGAAASVHAASQPLDAPLVAWGRLMGSCWLRLSRAGDTFTAQYSPDGSTWKNLGTITLALPRDLRAGLAGCSAIKGSTTIKFDNVILNSSR